MKNDVLVLTLGHNSSAILVRDGAIVGGYEEERLTMKKSDSSFPYFSVNLLHSIYGLKGATAIASHWYPDGRLPLPNKHWNPAALLETMQIQDIDFIAANYSHHDAHRDSVLVFAGDDFPVDCHIIVMDGFGTQAEHTSVYRRTKDGVELLNRFYGYKYSPGLFYQYATKFCGMTMHAHEYKMLAYETRMLSIIEEDTLKRINDHIDEFSTRTFHYMIHGSNQVETLDTLPIAEDFVTRTLSAFIRKFYGYSGKTETYVTRVFTSYFAQRHLENIVKGIRNLHEIENLMVAGGVFYNVKMNHILCDSIPGKFCAMPLAGDQGAGIGLYNHLFGKLEWPDHLFWGHRLLNYDQLAGLDKMRVVYPENMLRVLKQELEIDERVNVVRGAMEFGPRALCHTSTLAIPTLPNTIMINTMNDRTTEMPFGLVMSESQAKEMLVDTEKVHKSLDYMIMARRVNPEYNDLLRSGSHYYPLERMYTCRPQVTKDPVIVELVEYFGPLINTSWNFHGVPIVYGNQAIIHTHTSEQGRTPKPINTIIEGE